MANILQREPIGPVTPTNSSRPPAQRKHPGKGKRNGRESDRKHDQNRDENGDDRHAVDEYV